MAISKAEYCLSVEQSNDNPIQQPIEVHITSYATQRTIQRDKKETATTDQSSTTLPL